MLPSPVLLFLAGEPNQQSYNETRESGPLI